MLGYVLRVMCECALCAYVRMSVCTLCFLRTLGYARALCYATLRDVCLLCYVLSQRYVIVFVAYACYVCMQCMYAVVCVMYVCALCTQVRYVCVYVLFARMYVSVACMLEYVGYVACMIFLCVGRLCSVLFCLLFV